MIENHIKIHQRESNCDFPQIDIIVPTASLERWPASSSIRFNRKTAGKHMSHITFYPIVSNGPSFSFAKSVNEGLEQRDEDSHVLLLNDDCFLDKNWVPRFMAAVRSHPESGIFGALLRFPSNPEETNHFGNLLSGRNAINHMKPRYQHAGGFIPSGPVQTLSALFRFAFWHRAPFWTMRMIASTGKIAFPGHYHNMHWKNRIHLITAAAMLLTPEILKVLPSFDERYPLAFEDTDYCLRALEYDFEPVLVSDVTGIHHESLTTGHLEDVKRKSFQIFSKEWSNERIHHAIQGHKGIVHPEFCHCGDWTT